MEPAGVYFCPIHNGVANEDQDTCDFYDRMEQGACILTNADGENADDCTTHDHEEAPACDLKPCFYFPVPPADTLRDPLFAVEVAAYGDSNDAEFEALNDALDAALFLLDVSRAVLGEDEITKLMQT